jgi:poly(A) polymerase
MATSCPLATIAFASDWPEDAARRDFTINALYAHPETLAIADYFGGLEDLAARRVRFGCGGRGVRGVRGRAGRH